MKKEDQGIVKGRQNYKDVLLFLKHYYERSMSVSAL